MPSEHYSHQLRVDLTEQRFGNWTVLERGTPGGAETRWRCVCVCGTEREVKGSVLRTGRSTGCGCHRGPGTPPSFDRLADRFVALHGELDYLLTMLTQVCGELYGDLELSGIHARNVESLGRIVRNVRLCLRNVRQEPAGRQTAQVIYPPAQARAYGLSLTDVTGLMTLC